MIEVQVRGGTFPPGTTCEFRDDQFFFEEVVQSRNAIFYLGDAVEARVIEESQESVAQADAGIILCSAAAGAFVGACWSEFSFNVSILFGAVIGGLLAHGSEFPIAGKTTFEMRFSDDRTLVGTVDTAEWGLIRDTWRVLSSATPSMLRPAKAFPSTALSPK